MITEKSRSTGPATRACILQSAQKLFLSKGYEATTVQDIMEACQIAKGTLYHHFPGKLEILEALTEVMVEESLIKVRDLAETPSLSAREKLVAIFQNGASVSPELVSMAIVVFRTLFRDENLLLRYRIQKELLRRVVPLFVRVVQQGVEEGLVHCRSAQAAGLLIAEMAQNMKEAISVLMIHPDTSTEPWEQIEEIVASYSDGMERVLGSEPGLLSLQNSPAMKSMLEAIKKHFESQGGKA